MPKEWVLPKTSTPQLSLKGTLVSGTTHFEGVTLCKHWQNFFFIFPLKPNGYHGRKEVKTFWKAECLLEMLEPAFHFWNDPPLVEDNVSMITCPPNTLNKILLVLYFIREWASPLPSCQTLSLQASLAGWACRRNWHNGQGRTYSPSEKILSHLLEKGWLSHCKRKVTFLEKENHIKLWTLRTTLIFVVNYIWIGDKVI
jgi:hypothetical protein